MDLIECCRTGDDEGVRKLLSGKANPNVQETLSIRHYRPQPQIETPLYLATVNNNFNMVKLLLEHEANPNTLNSHFGITPLYYAGCRGYYDILDLLLTHESVDINIQCGADKETLLHVSCIQHNKKLFDVLLDSPKLDINIQSDKGVTPLGILCSEKVYSCKELAIRLLDDPRTDINLLHEKRHPITTVSHLNMDIIQLFLNNPSFNPNVGERSICVLVCRNEEILLALLSHPKFDPSNGFFEALNITINGKHDRCVELLLEECQSLITLELVKNIVQTKEFKHNPRRVYYTYLFCKFGGIEPEAIAKKCRLARVLRMISKNTQKSALNI